MYLPRPDSSIDFSEITGRRMMSAAVRTLTRTPPRSCARAGCSIRTASALSRSTTLSESARITITDGRFAAERRSGSSGAGATTRTRRSWPSPAPSASRTATNALVFGSSAMPNGVHDADRVVVELRRQGGAQRDAAHLAWAASARRSAGAGRTRRRRRGSAARCASPGGRARCPSGGTASCRRRGPRRGSWCRACRVRRPASWATTAWWSTASFTGAANSASARSTFPTAAPVRS